VGERRGELAVHDLDRERARVGHVGVGHRRRVGADVVGRLDDGVGDLAGAPLGLGVLAVAELGPYRAGVGGAVAVGLGGPGVVLGEHGDGAGGSVSHALHIHDELAGDEVVAL